MPIRMFITATSKEVDELIASGCDVALDATKQTRPKTLSELVDYIRQPNVEIRYFDIRRSSASR